MSQDTGEAVERQGDESVKTLVVLEFSSKTPEVTKKWLFDLIQSPVPKLKSKGVVTAIYPLHEPSKIKPLEHKWYLGAVVKQPLGSDEIEEPRPNYWGPPRISPITGQQEQYYPPLKRKFKTYCISYPLVLLSMKIATVVMLVYFKLQLYMEEKYAKSGGIIGSVMLLVPSIFYAVMIAVLNYAYHLLATFLTEWENHRLESSFQNHLIVKLVLFYFVNCFYSLFYIAFYLQDIELLRTDTFADYLELFLQFGYTFLFSSVYPMATFWALLNNVIEIRTDAFKMCRIYQRPFAMPSSSIGAWQSAFEAMSVIAVITNCALIGMAANTAHWLPEMTPVNAVLMFVAIE
ncbi:hypothetical protein QZH41_014558, partial [Actinostola sp. cb2023]